MSAMGAFNVEDESDAPESQGGLTQMLEEFMGDTGNGASIAIAVDDAGSSEQVREPHA